MNQHTTPGPGDWPEDYQAHDTYDTAYDEPDPGFEPGFDPGGDLPEPPKPINWNLLSADDLEAEWLELNKWVHWLRRTYGLPTSVIPPFWHHHPELVWELSALHLHWLGAYDPEQNASAPIGWHRDFADARARLREWVAASGTRLDRDRPTRQTSWPGEDPAPPVEDLTVEDRESEFVDFVRAEVAQRRQAEDEFFRHLDDQAETY
ncbi:hypothetical protein M3B43_09115 [Nesterenkonia massiliensis]|uniref:DUF4913 domain-containing protein n=1 Tax=Nesterenkonia massiliensis TaxID=1232429 RepID=A0ABT2HS02_9MICC|nr:hypothetical protein [Nesterenkonia massiliensis]MCT1607482.1 hypothetical protein [Nesterenkonia massiliensis]